MATTNGIMNRAHSEPIVHVSAVPTGQLFMPDKWILAGADHSKKTLYPDYSFYIHHEPFGKALMFDLGIRKVRLRKWHVLSTSQD